MSSAMAATPGARTHAYECAAAAAVRVALVDDLFRLQRGLGLSPGARTTADRVTEDEQQVYSALVWHCGGCTNWPTPGSLPCALQHKLMNLAVDIEPHTYSWSCVSTTRGRRATNSGPSHRFIDVTIGGSWLLNAETIVCG